MTHDLYHFTLQAFGATISRAVICDLVGDIYHARLIIEAENEIMERKIIELGARPSDCIALAVRCRAPLYVVSELWNNLEDMSTELANLRNSQDP